MSAIVYFGFVALLALLRISELMMSNRNATHHAGRFKPRSEPVFKWMVMLHASMYLALPLEWGLRRPQIGGSLTYVSIAVVALALLLRFWTLRHIGKSWNVRIIGGDGYPICDTGPYAWIRHPNYLVVILEVCFIPLIAHLWMSAIALSLGNAAVLFFRIRAEEQILGQNEVWVRKMQPKPRFLPGLF